MGAAHFAGFAPTKAAQRILAESMARDLGPKGIHVSFVAIDAVIDFAVDPQALMQTSQMNSFGQPDVIAQECYRMAHQPKSAWSFSSVIRPFGEHGPMNS